MWMSGRSDWWAVFLYFEEIPIKIDTFPKPLPKENEKQEEKQTPPGTPWPDPNSIQGFSI
jgi:hypothetical protein